jgi:hypothetical protein
VSHARADRTTSPIFLQSLFSLTPSLTKQLYQYRGGAAPCPTPPSHADLLTDSPRPLASPPERTFQSLNDYYFLPVDDGGRKIEELHVLFVKTLFDGKLYREPVGQEGVIPSLMGEGGRMLDIGTYGSLEGPLHLVEFWC